MPTHASPFCPMLSFVYAYSIDTSVDEMLGEANVIEGGEGWDPDGDCWIP